VENSIDLLRQQLLKMATPQRKAGAEAYMRNKFNFIGVDTTNRRMVFKDWIKNIDLPDYEDLDGMVKKMWALEREFHYCAIELAILYKNEWQPSFYKLIEYCIVHNSWWDTVDPISYEWAGTYFLKFPEKIKPITGKWNKSDNFWLQRASILFQKRYKKSTDSVLLAQYIENCASSNEFFIQKVIGWALREYGKNNPNWVRAFVQTHQLKPLSKKEALKNL
jgi:3-methyladenine DNA glycosylase AlkD